MAECVFRYSGKRWFGTSWFFLVDDTIFDGSVLRVGTVLRTYSVIWGYGANSPADYWANSDYRIVVYALLICSLLFDNVWSKLSSRLSYCLVLMAWTGSGSTGIVSTTGCTSATAGSATGGGLGFVTGYFFFLPTFFFTSTGFYYTHYYFDDGLKLLSSSYCLSYWITGFGIWTAGGGALFEALVPSALLPYALAIYLLVPGWPAFFNSLAVGFFTSVAYI